MKIVVIGRTGRSRSRTVWALRREGHDVMAAAPASHREMRSEAAGDAGSAGEPLRRLLTGIGLLLRDAWLGPRRHSAGLERVSAAMGPDAATARVIVLGSRLGRRAGPGRSPAAPGFRPTGRALH